MQTINTTFGKDLEDKNTNRKSLMDNIPSKSYDQYQNIAKKSQKDKKMQKKDQNKEVNQQ